MAQTPSLGGGGGGEGGGASRESKHVSRSQNKEQNKDETKLTFRKLALFSRVLLPVLIRFPRHLHGKNGSWDFRSHHRCNNQLLTDVTRGQSTDLPVQITICNGRSTTATLLQCQSRIYVHTPYHPVSTMKHILCKHPIFFFIQSLRSSL